MMKTNKIRTGLAAAVLAIGLGAAGTGVAFAATPAPAPPAAESDTAAPADPTAQLHRMDQMMATMVASVPADQRAAATRMHEQMRPAMTKMLSEGGMNGMGQMGSDTHGMTGG
ncbi:hypothetical protein [Pseudonocardia sp. GCM10023141]|uniref:hypothetical protein n=1 Tax=Pseudonocardia sp. GCM10023141 TaxID=3252653 RepID=UPI00360878A0